ncbi:TetR/AcrR family transcriptional regulator [Sphingoaurantiacus capsulatus]|uniref:TetR/AcrR family transcriptional regulator n=1 Tax=Sphingoaurantiacus capsulatus TaxID=1771310 RepID=A0ABV7X5R4_9SPHN
MQNSDQPSETVAARGRGRPRAFDRDAALTRAMRLFWAKGYDATSVADLTAAMGIGAPSLYAAFGSKEGLYTEALQHYGGNYDTLVWGRFAAAPTARAAIHAFLYDSAVALDGTRPDDPPGCMVTLSAVDAAVHPGLCGQLRAARAVSLQRLSERIEQGIADGEIPATVDTRALARFIQTVQYGMSLLARDGAGRAELEGVAAVAMLGWDARVKA